MPVGTKLKHHNLEGAEAAEGMTASFGSSRHQCHAQTGVEILSDRRQSSDGLLSRSFLEVKES